MERLIVLSVGRNTSTPVTHAVHHMCGEVTRGLPPQLTGARDTVKKFVQEHEMSWATHAYFVVFEAKEMRKDFTSLVVLFSEATTLPDRRPDYSDQLWLELVMTTVVSHTFPCDVPGSDTRLVPLKNTYYTAETLNLRFDRNERNMTEPRARIETRCEIGGTNFSDVTEEEVLTELAHLLGCELDVAHVTTYPPTPTP